jgi:predicted nuclease of restriction endonuclease-like (RecB) superfamily
MVAISLVVEAHLTRVATWRLVARLGAIARPAPGNIMYVTFGYYRRGMSSLVPSDYVATLESIKRLIHEARYVAQRRVNTELLGLYWQIGSVIIERQKSAPWGSKVLVQLSADLRAEFPTAKGFSPAKLKYMRRFAEAWPDRDAIGQRPVDQLPWGHVIELLEKLDDPELRDWYSAKDIAQGWSRPVLAHQITTRLHPARGCSPI